MPVMCSVLRMVPVKGIIEYRLAITDRLKFEIYGNGYQLQ